MFFIKIPLRIYPFHHLHLFAQFPYSSDIQGEGTYYGICLRSIRSVFTEHKHGPYPPWPPCSGSLCTVLRKRTAFHPLSPYSSAIQKKGEGDEGGQNQGGILLFGTCYFFKCKKRERNSIKKRGEKYYAALSPCIVLLPSPFSF